MENQPQDATFDSRHARGLSARELDEAAYEGLLERFGPTGVWIVDHVEGELWSRPGLSRRDRALAAFAAVAAQGGQGSVLSAGRLCLDAGVTTTELDEVLGHVMAYAGLARATDAYDILAAIPDLHWPADRRPLPWTDGERLAAAHDVMGTVSGGRGPKTPEGGLTFLENRYGVVGGSVYRWIFGELWSRPGFSRRDRSLVVIAMLVALGELHELNTHAAAGVHHGLSRAEIDEVVISIYPYLGAPRTAAATRFIQQVWVDRDAAASA